MNAVIFYSVVCSVLIKTFDARVILEKYNVDRTNLIDEESALSVGGRLKLNEDEKIVSDLLVQWKHQEIDDSFENPQFFNFSRHYFTYKNEIDKSKVYQMLKRMPKGGALHVHSSLMLSADYLLNLTYENHLYVCVADDDIKLQFSNAIPTQPCQFKWTLLSDMRNASVDVASFDNDLKKYFTMYTENKDYYDADINTIWSRFNKVYYAIKSLISYRPVREKYFYESLKRFYNDNIMYIEIRSGLHNLYELDGTIHDKMYLADMYQRITKEFINSHPDFIGVKLILTRNRSANINQVREALDLARKLKNEMPDIFAGFDLVGQEDLGKPLIDFLPVLLEAKSDINFYLHGGETNWYGTPTDENLIDAVLLGSKRIGHAYALMKHPTLIASVYRQDIALEVNVISNTVLSLVHDVRNHPLASYLALGMPIVLSSDDPGAWDAEPLSHDFYVAFVGVASRHADLRTLKQLALNSIKYSALDDNERSRAYTVFDEKWEVFIKEIIEENS